MNKKIFGLVLGIGVVFLVAAVALGAVSAKPTDVKIGNETFHIPDGFKEVNRTENNKDIAVLFEQDKDTLIIIDVSPNEEVDILGKIPGDVNKTIGGKKGIYNEKVHSFNYLDNGNHIAVIGPDENTIADIIK